MGWTKVLVFFVGIGAVVVGGILLRDHVEDTNRKERREEAQTHHERALEVINLKEKWKAGHLIMVLKVADSWVTAVIDAALNEEGRLHRLNR